MQTVGDLFSISEDLWNIVQSDIENQAYHIQKLLVNELDNCKGKENDYTEGYIKEIQNAYAQEDIIMEELEPKEKQ